MLTDPLNPLSLSLTGDQNQNLRFESYSLFNLSYASSYKLLRSDSSLILVTITETIIQYKITHHYPLAPLSITHEVFHSKLKVSPL